MTHLATHFLLFFFNDTATTEIYTLSLHDALPISRIHRGRRVDRSDAVVDSAAQARAGGDGAPQARPEHPGGSRTVERSEEHTSELQSQSNLVCRLLLEKKKKYTCISQNDKRTKPL